jgi:uncharacterized membrane protein YoaK (UPF0700 family)
MFRHTGIRRTYKHNIRLAGLLSLTAGFVNVAGFLGFSVLTTNVTGHVAIFAEKLSQGDFHTAGVVALWMFMFFLGAFFSSIFIGKTGRNVRYAYTLPFILEAFILITVAACNHSSENNVGTAFFAGIILFAMGLQNAMVSMISGFVVRTTHLTGMFTDFGIELAELVQRRYTDKNLLKQKIALRIVIIGFFVFGGITGGFIFKLLSFKTFYFPAIILIIAMFYDIFRINILRTIRKYKRQI